MFRRWFTATFSLYIRKWNVTLSILLLREMSTCDVRCDPIWETCTPPLPPQWSSKESTGCQRAKILIHCFMTVWAAFCYTCTESPIWRLITRVPQNFFWLCCSACKNSLNSYNSARWQVRRRRRRCHFPFLCGFQTTLACQWCHIKTLREPSLSQRFDGWKDRWADRWLHR